MTRPARIAADKIMRVDALVAALEVERSQRRTIVFTNGCYDILHAGHLHLLETAAAQGDRLVVGVNADASVRRLKGEGRPFVAYSERSALLAALEVVDWVVGFDDDTPEQLIQAILPDVLVKGGDWSVDRIVGRDTVEAHGGRVMSVPLTPGRSTTSLVERIRSAPGDSPPRGTRS